MVNPRLPLQVLHLKRAAWLSHNDTLTKILQLLDPKSLSDLDVSGYENFDKILNFPLSFYLSRADTLTAGLKSLNLSSAVQYFHPPLDSRVLFKLPATLTRLDLSNAAMPEAWVTEMIQKARSVRYLDLTGTFRSSKFAGELLRLFRNVTLPLETLSCASFSTDPDYPVITDEAKYPYKKCPIAALPVADIQLAVQPFLTRLDLLNVQWLSGERILAPFFGVERLQFFRVSP